MVDGIRGGVDEVRLGKGLGFMSVVGVCVMFGFGEGEREDGGFALVVLGLWGCLLGKWMEKW